MLKIKLICELIGEIKFPSSGLAFYSSLFTSYSHSSGIEGFFIYY